MNPVIPVLKAENLTVSFPGRKKTLFRKPPETVALKNVDFQVRRGQSVAIVGESGSGKSTLVKTLLGLEKPSSGKVFYEDREISMKGRKLWLRAKTGMIFQDPYSSLDPKMTIGESVAEPLRALGVQEDHDTIVTKILNELELPEDSKYRFPAAFSGGQRQRIAIARALVHSPEVLIGDEPVSALDVLVRRRIIELLKTLRSQKGLTMITVTHDLGVVPDLAERVLVLKNGEVVEEGRVEKIFGDPQEQYTKSLILALPQLPKF